jgi:leucyl/phenylalanyl-tRNA--protein transferase
MYTTSGIAPKITPELIIQAYQKGYFPMAHGPNGEIEFCMFSPRGIIPLDDRFVVRKSLRQKIANTNYHIIFDTAFESVIRHCARHQSVDEDEIWLSNEMIAIYDELHRRGIAHSVEVWDDSESEPELIGGLYGLHFAGAFCGESMFSTKPYGSQIALVALVEHLRKQGFRLLDAQMPSEHLKQFGLYEVMHKEYLKLLDRALAYPVKF